MDNHSPAQRRKNMQAVKSKGSVIEKMMAKALWNAGLRYRKNLSSVTGKPDFAFIGAKIAVFCDSEFFHGRNWETKKYEIKSNRDFWFQKIENNIKRDIFVNKQLAADGWIVLRFWESDIKNNTETCVETVISALKTRKSIYEKSS
jgi:DNA mismatch endonuclease Vsr